jgi:hypothetical protein
MIFINDGVEYDTGSMWQFRTGDPDLPLICVTADRASVFLFSPVYRGGLKAVRANARAVRLVALGYRLPWLLEAAAEVPCPN